MRRQLSDRLFTTSVRRGLLGGNPALRSVAIGMVVIRGARRLVGRRPEIVKRVRMRPGTSMSVAVRRGGRR
ncbi:MAG: hypothetical protein O3B40_01550 [Actinobacteria bacterium]|nr:hypothetical protein [Actinomycetota bacterium]MDA2961272.1 hypothetical protein [Actinomycetota bacterium]MDA2994033.1 hypothetical protein [Actinomycetota bacterium]